MLSLLFALALTTLPAPPPGPAPVCADGPGKVYLTVEEALDLAFPGARIEHRTVYLTRE